VSEVTTQKNDRKSNDSQLPPRGDICAPLGCSNPERRQPNPFGDSTTIFGGDALFTCAGEKMLIVIDKRV